MEEVSMEIASAYVSLLPSAKGFGSKLNSQIGGDVTKAGRTSGSRFGKVFATSTMSPIRAIGAAALGLFAVDKVKNFLGASIGEAREAQKVSALTGQVIKTTGGAANVSAIQVGNLANAISRKVGIDDEAIQSGENMLLTFTNVRNEVGKGNKVFNQATRLAVDMSTALGGDAKSAALQLGKALNDPAKGVTKLARSGVSFTEQQIKQIKAMQQSGNLLGAQKIILGEVAKEFGGAAAAQATSGEKMSVAFGNLKEQIGTALLPVLDRVQDVITSKIIPAISLFITQMQNGTGAGGQFVAILMSFAGALGAVFGFISAHRDAVGFFASSVIGIAAAVKVWTIAQVALNFALTANPIGIVVVALAGLAAGLVYAYKRSETFRNIVNGTFTVVRAVVGSVAGWLSKYVPRAFAILVSGVRTYINIYRTVVVTAFKVVRAIIGAVGSFVAGSVKFYIAYLNGVRSVLGKVVSFVKSIPGKVVAALGNLGSALFNSGRALLEGFARGITSKVGEVYGAAKSALSKVRNLFPHSPAKEGPFSGKGWTLHSGVALMTGLADGIKRSKGKVRSAIVQVLDAVRQQVQQVTSSVSQAFGGDLFSSTNAVSFVRNLTSTTGMVGRLKSAFAKLMKWGWRPEALSALFQSGNSGLILSLASSQALATQAAHQYQSAQAGLSSLGATVANNQYALGQDRTLKKFDDLINAVKSVGIDVGSEINGATKKGKKKQR
jgi:phage-related protein